MSHELHDLMYKKVSELDTIGGVKFQGYFVYCVVKHEDKYLRCALSKLTDQGERHVIEVQEFDPLDLLPNYNIKVIDGKYVACCCECDSELVDLDVQYILEHTKSCEHHIQSFEHKHRENGGCHHYTLEN